MWFGSSPSCEKELPRRSRVFTSTHFQEYILLSNGLIQRTPCGCTLTEEVISYMDDQMIAQLGAEGIRFTDASTIQDATVHIQQSYTELACFRSFF